MCPNVRFCILLRWKYIRPERAAVEKMNVYERKRPGEHAKSIQFLLSCRPEGYLNVYGDARGAHFPKHLPLIVAGKNVRRQISRFQVRLSLEPCEFGGVARLWLHVRVILQLTSATRWEIRDSQNLCHMVLCFPESTTVDTGKRL